jgi:hypothetical protein
MTRDEIASLNPNAIVWDNLDDAIIGLAKREDFGPLVIYGPNGELDIKLDMDYYQEFEEGEDMIDNWGRGTFDGIVAYDIDKVIKLLADDMEVSDNDIEAGSTKEETARLMALEHFGYNIAGGFVGEYTPLHLFLVETE